MFKKIALIALIFILVVATSVSFYPASATEELVTDNFTLVEKSEDGKLISAVSNKVTIVMQEEPFIVGGLGIFSAEDGASFNESEELAYHIFNYILVNCADKTYTPIQLVYADKDMNTIGVMNGNGVSWFKFEDYPSYTPFGREICKQGVTQLAQAKRDANDPKKKIERMLKNKPYIRA